MKKAYSILAYLLAAEVVINGMAMAYAIAAVFRWVEEDGGVINKALLDADSPDFPGIGAFMLHGMNGMMVIPLLAVALLVVSFFAKVTGGTRRAAVLLGLVVLQVVLGLSAHGVSALAPLHVLNAFGIFVMAILTARSVATTSAAHAPAATQAPVPV
ncbi:MAG: hypothetical protein JWN77_509 [Frankiales bacterium]|jgi:heme A synthase|nr:hypothetical protein [Frankiales bacterium]